MTTEQKFRPIKELAPKPSDAIKAMSAGLRELPDEKFVIDMGTFGCSRNGICFGCAATCAVYQLLDSSPNPLSMCAGILGQASWFGYDYDTLYDFETAINAFRSGKPSHLFRFYGYTIEDVPAELWLSQWWLLDTDDWRWQLPSIDRYVEKLEAAGL